MPSANNPPPPPPPPPLPLAPNRAALSNQISLLLASHASVLKSLSPSPAAQQPKRRTHTLPDSEADFKAPPPNHGVGYVPTPKDTDARRDTQLLRGRLLGGRGRREDGRGKVKGKVGAESESEDDEGRTALGKRKRTTRRVQREGEKEVVQPVGRTGEDGEKGVTPVVNSKKDDDDAAAEEDVQDGETSHSGSPDKDPATSTRAADDVAKPTDHGPSKKRKKNRKKKKMDTQAQGAEAL